LVVDLAMELVPTRSQQHGQGLEAPDILQPGGSEGQPVVRWRQHVRLPELLQLVGQDRLGRRPELLRLRRCQLAAADGVSRAVFHLVVDLAMELVPSWR